MEIPVSVRLYLCLAVSLGVSPDPLLWLPLCNRNKIAVGNASTRFFATLTALMEDE